MAQLIQTRLLKINLFRSVSPFSIVNQTKKILTADDVHAVTRCVVFNRVLAAMQGSNTVSVSSSSHE